MTRKKIIYWTKKYFFFMILVFSETRRLALKENKSSVFVSAVGAVNDSCQKRSVWQAKERKPFLLRVKRESCIVVYQ